MDILDKVENYYNAFKGEKGIIGRSVNNRPIYYLAVKKAEKPKLIVQFSIHAREYITSYLAIKLIEDYKNSKSKASVYFLPMLNPDGVKIALEQNPLYKANANGVDLNVNFDANFGSGEQNVFCKASQNYVGEYAFCEPETRAIRDFTLSIKPHATISYHSKGQEIYYEFFQDEKRKKRDYLFAKSVSDATGYAIKSTPNSAGGYKDWCIQKLKIPALTIEVGSDSLSHPITKEHLDQIYKENKGVIDASVQTLTELICKKNL
ncbi:MAG: hypothetical protein E7348_00295 [Clostridiales bacterium]|nr:hypothetical protein [Clostridiales bacterium]